MGDYYVNASTSLVLAQVSSIVYLSTLYSPGTLITIRDNNGAARLNSTITVSTTSGVSFLDGTNRYTITQPYGFLTVTPRTSTIWSLVNTFAFPNQLIANVDSVTAKFESVSSIQANLVSSKQILVSSIGVNCNAAKYEVDVNGIINAKDFYKNGARFQGTGDLPTINTSSITINAASVIEYTKRSTLAGITTDRYPFASFDYGQTWTSYSRIPFTQSTIMTNILYDDATQTYNAFGYTTAYGPSTLQLSRSVNLSNWSEVSLGNTFSNATHATKNSSFYYLYSSNGSTYSNYKTSNFSSYTQYSIPNTITHTVKYLSSPNIFVACGKGSLCNAGDIPANATDNLKSILFSQNAETWNRVSSIGPNTANANILEMYDVVYGNGLFIAGGLFQSNTGTPPVTTYPALVYTNNISSLTGFSNTNLNSNYIPLSLAFNGTNFVALTLDYTNSNGPIFYSSDGATWTSTGSNIYTSNINLNNRPKVKWNGSNFVVANPNKTNETLYSSDGITWALANQGSNFIDIVMGSTSTIQTVPNMAIGQTKVYTADPVNSDPSMNQFIFYSTLLKINNSIYLSNTGQVGIGTSTMRSVLDVNGTLTTTQLNLSSSSTRLTTSSGSLFVNTVPVVTLDVLSNFAVPISTMSTLTILSSLNVTNPLNPGTSGVVLTSTLGVNCNAPRFQADVNGTLTANTLLATTVSTQAIVATSVGIGTGSPSVALQVQGTVRATRGFFTQLGVNTITPSYTLDVAGSFNTSSFFVNGVPFVGTYPISSVIASTVRTFGTTGSNYFLQSTFFEKPINTTIFNTSTIQFYKTSGTTYFSEPLTINSFVSAYNRNTSNVWVAVGRDTTNLVKFSTDGSTWQNATGATFSGAQESWAVVWNGKTWLTSISDTNSSNARLFTSDSGSTWTQITTSGTFPNNNIRSLVWAGNQFVAVGQTSGASNTTIARSPDGITWTTATSGGFSPSFGGRGVAFDGRRLVAVGGYSSSVNETIQYSDDLGATWLSIPSNGFVGSARGVATSGYLWVAAGVETSGTSNSLKYSYNGVNWSNASNAFTQYAFSVGWNGSIWVATGIDSVSSNSIKYSYDGINWSNGTNGFSTGSNGLTVAWNGSLWVAGGQDGTSNARIKTSPNGITWTDSTSGAFSSAVNGVGFSSNVYPDFQTENLSLFGKNQFNSAYSTNSIHLQTSSILINNALRITQPNLINQTLTNPTVDIIGAVRTQSLLTQSTLGIRNSNPLGTLDIQLPSTSGVFSNYPILRGNVSSETAVSTLLNSVNTWCALMPVPQSNSPNLVFYYRGGTSGNSNYKAQITGAPFFTGQHANLSIDSRINVSNLSSCVGLIVSSADQGYYSILPNGTIIEGSAAIFITEALPKIKLSDTDMDKGVWGVVTNHMNEAYTASGQRELDYQSLFASPLQGRIRVNGVGEGAIWVTNINGSLLNGDYICSSVIPGYGRKQDDDVVHNYTVAKATMSCSFQLNQSKYKCEQFIYNGQTYLRAFIGCSYHCS